MTAIASSISGMLNARLNRWVAEHRDGDLIAQISPEMLRHLQKQGVVRAFWTYLLIVPVVYFLDRAIAPSLIADYTPMSDLHYVVQPFVFLLLFAATLERAAQYPIDREIRFYRQHGKWRWES